MKHKHADIITDIALAHATAQRAGHMYFPPAVIVQALAQGIKAKSVLLLAQYIPLSLLCETLDLSESALRRRIKLDKRLNVTETDNILQLSKVWSALVNFFNHDKRSLEHWLQTELPALDGAKPAELLSTNFGRKVIIETLEAMKYGDFA